MPEITEIRNYADFINKKLKNKEIIEINILNGRYKKHGPFEKFHTFKKNLPLKVINTFTKGKFLYIALENDFYMFSTLGLQGGWCYLANNKNKYEFSKNMDAYLEHTLEEKINSYIENAKNHLNVEFKTKYGSLYYYDVLSFGTLKVIKGINELNIKLDTIGPDIMEESTDLELFENRIKKNNNLAKKIGIVLMDQKTISGIGNYLRADILYLSKINPFRKVNSLTNRDIKNIFINAKILTWGEYDRDMAKRLKIIDDKTKLASDYDRLFFVYSQKTDINGNKVLKKELYEGSQKRFIYYVPKIQK